MQLTPDTFRLVSLASVSLGVVFLLIYVGSTPHLLYRLIFGVVFTAVGIVNLVTIWRKSRRRER